MICSIKLLLIQYKDTKKEHYLLQLLQRFTPLISKYTRKLSEEYRTDFIILCIECFNKMPVLEEPFIVNYIHKAIKNKYISLSKNISASAVTYYDDMSKVEEPTKYNSFSIIELKSLIETLTPLQQVIIVHKLCYDSTDQEIADLLHVSRQYIQKIKCEGLNSLKHHYSIKVN